MQFVGINYIAVIVAAIAGFAFGSVYYMVLGKRWTAALGKTEAEIKGAGKTMPVVPMLIALVAQFMMAYLLAGVLGHLGLAHMTVRGGVITGMFLWGGFVVTTMAVNYAFQGSRRALWFIDAGHWLGVLVVQGLVIGAFGV
ncbi:MAG: DUF1761 domain-containing protein [Alphaproteobacteria bacterium]|nr:DUF1761 domain-containing protein [Alphaproteobacteria bacterium]